MTAIDPEGLETRVMHSLVDFRGKDVLEIGSGDGRLTWRFAGNASSVLAVEPLADRARQAVAATPDELRPVVRFVEADATTYAYPAEAFDIAILSYSL